MRKWKIRCNYCGYEEYSNYHWLFIKAIFKKRFYRTCPRCHRTSCYLFMPKIVHDSIDKKEKVLNKQKLWDDRLWLK